MQIAKQKMVQMQDEYVVIDIETTGLSHLSDEIIEIGALRVAGGEPVEEYDSLVRCKNKIPETIKNSLGITDEELLRDGRELHLVLQEFNTFLSDRLLVCYNAASDLNFIQAACRKENLPVPRNICVDTLILARRKLKEIRDYRLYTIAEKLSVDTNTDRLNRTMRDCYITYGIYTKLNEI
jgi:DNA polymerase III epsilon subunit family exonuclease